MRKTSDAGPRSWYALFKTEAAERFFYVLIILWICYPIFSAVWNIVSRAFPNGRDDRMYWVTSTYLPFRVLGGVCLIAGIVFVIAVFCRRGLAGSLLRTEPWHFFLLFMAVWSVVSTLLSDNVYVHFMDRDGEFSFLIWCAIYVCSLLVTDGGRRLRVLRVFAWTANIQCLIMILTDNAVLSADLVFVRSAAIFFNSNHFGYYLCMSILCLAGLFLYDPVKKYRQFHLLFFFFQLYTLILNDTLGCYLAVLLALPFVYIVFRRSRYFPAGAGVRDWLRLLAPVWIFIAVSALFYFGVTPSGSMFGWSSNFTTLAGDVSDVVADPNAAGGAGSGRMRLWIGAVKAIARKPVFGWGGEGNLSEGFRQYGHTKAHNELLQYGVNYGIPAVLAYLAMLVTLAVGRWKTVPSADAAVLTAAGGVFGYVVSSMVGCAIFNTAPFFFILLGFTAVRAREEPASGKVRAMVKRPAWGPSFIAALALSAAAVAALSVGCARYEESEYEYTDIEWMRYAAEYAAGRMDDFPEGRSVYWFDKNRTALISAEEENPMPYPYGYGTVLDGHYTYDPVTEYGTILYDNRTDTQSKIIQITVDTSKTGSERITAEWVDARDD